MTLTLLLLLAKHLERAG